MKVKFKSSDYAEGFASGLACPDGLDLYVEVNGDTIDFDCGLDDDHPILKEAIRLALLDGIEVKTDA